ncbi:MAG: hypothetical protein HGA45_04490 [Chloroflexales bacterium]|nr:hypothetical protein [Chloroflexales bacterium]
MITPEYLRVLFDYHAWATTRVLETAARLDPADLDTAPLAGLGSLRHILVHALSAEWVWRSRLGGVSPRAHLAPADLPTLAAIRTRWAGEEVVLRSLITGLDAAALAENLVYQTLGGQAQVTPRWQILVHLANHGTQHRSEAAALLTALGHSPGDLDLIVFFRAQVAPTPPAGV